MVDNPLCLCRWFGKLRFRFRWKLVIVIETKREKHWNVVHKFTEQEFWLRIFKKKNRKFQLRINLIYDTQLKPDLQVNNGAQHFYV